jgi:hypothetical protein
VKVWSRLMIPRAMGTVTGPRGTGLTEGDRMEGVVSPWRSTAGGVDSPCADRDPTPPERPRPARPPWLSSRWAGLAFCKKGSGTSPTTFPRIREVPPSGRRPTRLVTNARAGVGG